MMQVARLWQVHNACEGMVLHIDENIYSGTLQAQRVDAIFCFLFFSGDVGARKGRKSKIKIKRRLRVTRNNFSIAVCRFLHPFDDDHPVAPSPLLSPTSLTRTKSLRVYIYMCVYVREWSDYGLTYSTSGQGHSLSFLFSSLFRKLIALIQSFFTLGLQINYKNSVMFS